MAENKQRRYCVVIELEASSTLERIANDMPQIIRVLASYSDTEPQIAFRSNDGILFSYFVKSALSLNILRAEFERNSGDGRDKMIAFEIGRDLTGTEGFSRAWTWLQRN